MGRKQAEAPVVVPLVPREAVTGKFWPDLAACAEIGDEVFFAAEASVREQARAVCLSCPVRLRCLADAVASSERFGVWGGYDFQNLRQRHSAVREVAHIAAAAVSPVAA